MMVEGTQNVAVRSPGAQLWRNRDFNIFWAGQALSVLGDAFAIIALPLLVLQATGSVVQMGLVTGVFGVGQLIAGLFAGALVDRMDRRKLMIACDVTRALLFAAIPLAWWLAGPQLWLIYVVTLFGSALGMLFQVAYITAVANLAERDQITDANGRLQATFALAFVLGPMLAGQISGVFGPAASIGIDAVSFVISAFSLTLIRLRRASVAHDEPVRRGLGLDGIVTGIRFLLRQPTLRAITLLFFVFALLAAGGNDLFVYYLKHDLGQGDGAVGTVFGVASLGAIVGAVVAPWLRRRLGFGAGFIGGMALSGLALLAFGLTPTIVLVAPLAMIFTFADTIKGINSMSLRQEITPDHLLGRVTAAFWTLVMVPGPFGAAFATALGARIGAPAVLALMGGLAIVLALVGLFTPARARRPELQN
jgi:MFS family permease